jgi:hypothetical protein
MVEYGMAFVHVLLMFFFSSHVIDFQEPYISLIAKAFFKVVCDFEHLSLTLIEHFV